MKRRLAALAALCALCVLCFPGCPNPWLNRLFRSDTAALAAASDDGGGLAGLAVSAGTLSPVFDPAVTEYTVTVGGGVSSIGITAVKTNSQDSLTINGVPAGSGVPVNVSLLLGDNPVTVIVLPHGGGFKTYTVTVHRSYAEGDTGPAGGKIFYVFSSGSSYGPNGDWRYLEAAPAELPGTYAWSTTISSFLSPPTLDLIGTGWSNTITILAADSNAPAAKACDDYVLNGFDDWFLPSAIDLLRIRQNLDTSVYTPGDFYWDSYQTTADQASWYELGGTGNGSTYMSNSNHVLPVRGF